MIETSNIEKVVMKRVYRMRVLRALSSSTILAAAVAAAALYGIGREVWVAKVFINMPQVTNLSAQTSFWSAAFLHTHLIVEALIVATLLALIILARESARLLASLLFAPARA